MAAHFRDNDDVITQINVVHLVDIMLVLIIIFMLTASFISTPSVPVSLPKAFTSNSTAPASQSLVLDSKGTIFFLNKPVSRDQLLSQLKEAAALNPELRIVLSADTDTPH